MANLQDRRRVLGPSDTQQLKFKSPDTDLISQLSSTATKNKKDSATIRPIFIRTGPVANASGSAFLEISADPSDVIQVQVSVHGPRPIRGSFIETGLFSVEAKLSPFSVDNQNPETSQHRNNAGSGAPGGGAISRPNGTSPLERTVAAFVESSLTPAVRLEQYPKSGIDVFVTILRPGSNPKALQAACVNAATVALVDAGIALRDLVTCGAAILTRSEKDDNKVESIVVDPGVPTVSGHQLDMAVSYMTAHNSEIVGMAVDGGVLSPQILETCLSVTLKAAKDTRALINGVLLGEFKYKEKVISQALSSLLSTDNMDIDQ